MNASVMNEILSSYSSDIEKIMRDSIQDFGLEDSGLRSPIEYALFSGGKRIRPLIVLMVAKNLGKGYDVSDAAVAIEFVHTSTLIADDLPCMDDDIERRNRPTVHIAFSESKALLASYALISAAYERIRLNAHKLRVVEDFERANLAYDKVLENVTYNTGAHGVIGGQYEDMFSSDLSEDTVLSILHKKTGALFELSFVMGWLFGGGSLSGVDLIKDLSYQFGLLFQIGDDLLDFAQDSAKDEACLNYAILFGKERAKSRIDTSVKQIKALLGELRERHAFQIEEFEALVEFLSSRLY
ncbi:polyprenyl synthetase family protein [Chlamydiifrater phoenicopteri]|uniref:polyprenyl synthetase family protein n=1 Tax=Chlamydiifrater phoenicopteri TaxID=2681469 RepID=UPI001FE44F63|nr:polyprenyl synthetase family protein [Chlamydiifrater phoenicopteri]